MSTQISVRFDEDIKIRLENLSSSSGRSVSQVIRQCIIDHLEDLEDVYDSIRRLEKGEKSSNIIDLKNELLGKK